MASRIRSIEFRDFMSFETQTFKLNPATFITGPVSAGKSSIIIGIFLALGQDDILISYGYRSIEDVIRIGKDVAHIKLIVSTPNLSELRGVYGSTMEIYRKIQLQDGVLLPSVWKVKSFRSDDDNPYCRYRTVQAEYINSTISSQLGLGLWYGSIPYLITPPILDIHLEQSHSFWYNEFCRLFKKQVISESNEKIYLEGELKKLKTMLEAQEEKMVQMDRGKSILKIEKLKLQIHVKTCKLNSVVEEINEMQCHFVAEFEETYKQHCSVMNVFGLCKINMEEKILNFAVDDHLFEAPTKNSVQHQYAVSSLRSKKLAIFILIVTYWKTFDISPIYIIESMVEGKELRRFFASKAFYDLVKEKQSCQFIVTGQTL